MTKEDKVFLVEPDRERQNEIYKRLYAVERLIDLGAIVTAFHMSVRYGVQFQRSTLQRWKDQKIPFRSTYAWLVLNKPVRVKIHKMVESRGRG